MKWPLLKTGFVIWAVATVCLRVGGSYVLQVRAWPWTLTLFLVSFIAMAVLARRLCRAIRLTRKEWPAGAISLALPTLILDPFSAAFFPVIFPHVDPTMAGIFGGWMLISCAGALLGALPLRDTTQSA